MAAQQYPFTQSGHTELAGGNDGDYRYYAVKSTTHDFMLRTLLIIFPTFLSVRVDGKFACPWVAVFGRRISGEARIRAPGPLRILVGATGSVASIKVPLLVKKIKEVFEGGVEIRIVATTYALHFFKPADVEPVEVFTDASEWEAWQKISDPVLHIELRNWADAMVIAPLDANTLAKVANGMCDNLLTCILRAWDDRRPVIVCPAMNTYMWDHKFTARHLKLLKGMLRYTVVQPISKTLACGDTGVGAMAEPGTIARVLHDTVEQRAGVR
ncbi:hypothetical protein HK104_007685 [Borealophlyctis nickersoniae]|nr:hypothetical protein HK104_007685 [Borealophlyctis nickersoniae]